MNFSDTKYRKNLERIELKPYHLKSKMNFSLLMVSFFSRPSTFHTTLIVFINTTNVNYQSGVLTVIYQHFIYNLRHGKQLYLLLYHPYKYKFE